MKVDCVGACVGVRGSRIKNVIDEINSERIDIVRWNDSMQVMIPNALQPAEIQEVQLYQQLGRAIVLVAEDQLSLAIGRRGQNVRLASKLVGWDIDIMTVDELARDLEKTDRWFSQIPGMIPEMIEVLITEGFFSYTDLTFLEPEHLAEMLNITSEEAFEMIDFAEQAAERIEREGEPELEEAPAAETTTEEQPVDEGEADAQTDDETTPETTDAEAIVAGEILPEPVDSGAGFESLFKAEEDAPPVEPEEPIQNNADIGKESE
jgi:N utilization substance protein A